MSRSALFGLSFGGMALLPNFDNSVSLFPQLWADKLSIVGVEAHELHLYLGEITPNVWRLSLGCMDHLQLLLVVQAIVIRLLERFWIF